MSISRRGILSALTLVPAHRVLRGWQEPRFSADVKVVNVFASVRDKRGHIVRNLAKTDFRLDEDGRPQTISYFSQETDLPLTLGILVDTSLSVRRVLSDERDASYRFLEQVLRPDKDLAFVIHFDSDVELLQDVTASRGELQTALDRLDSNGSSSYWQRRGRARGGGGTLLYDSVYLASNQVMKKQKERKALIVLSDGVDNGSRTDLMSSVEAAQRADTLAYCILFEDPEYYGAQRSYGGGSGQRDGGEVMEQIATETGGRFFRVSDRMPIQTIFQSIEEELRTQYSIGYSSDATNTSASYRHIHLETRQRGLIVQARQGYYVS